MTGSVALAPPEAAAADVRRTWVALQSLPVAIRVSHEGVSLQTFLGRATGLSQAHLSSRGVAVSDPKRQQEVLDHIHDQERLQLAELGLEALEIDKVLLEKPQGPLASFAYGLAMTTGQAFDCCIAYGKELDATAGSMLAALNLLELERYRDLLAAQVVHEAASLTDCDLDVDALSRTITDARSWAELVGPTEKLVDVLLFSYLAALDFEWSTGYFRTMEPTPTLVWLWPRLRADFDAAREGTSRGALVRTSRSLLQMMWLIVKRRYDGRWPSSLPQPMQVLQDTGLGEIEEVDMRRYFSGHRPPTAARYRQIWAALCQTASGGDLESPPALWIVLGAWMQESLAAPRSKGDPIEHWVLSEPAYRALWEGHLRRWRERLNVGTEKWPACLMAQSSSWSTLRLSSQSSGLSS